MNLDSTLPAGISAMLLCLSACGFTGIDELPLSDTGNAETTQSDVPTALDSGPDGATVDAFRADVASDGMPPDVELDAEGDTPRPPDDAGPDGGNDAGTDGGADAGPDAGCSPPAWGVSDDDTSDVAGDDFGRQVWTVRLCTVPALGEQLTLRFRARITALGTMYDHDLFVTYMYINSAGGASGGLDRTWAPERVEGDTFVNYTLLLPADIDDDGSVDWVLGDNELDLQAWSNYNVRLGKTGIDSMTLTGP